MPSVIAEVTETASTTNVVEESNESSSDDSDDEEESLRCIDNMPLLEGIRYWALSTNASIPSINKVLRLFQKTNAKVPKTAETLFKTNRVPAVIKESGGGQFWYNGIRKSLLTCVRNKKLCVDQIFINVSIDGLPLHKCGSTQFWPILFNIHDMPQVPVMTAAIFCGVQKPTSVEEYLRPMVQEINWLNEHGLEINGKHIGIKLRAVIADTPARAFIKGVIGHTGYSSCLKCTVEGSYHRAGRTVVFPGINAERRTDKSFRDGEYPEHTRMMTPLLDLRSFDIIEDVVVGDRLHLIDLGVMKRMLVGWLEGSLGNKKLSAVQISDMMNAMGRIKLPFEIHQEKVHPSTSPRRRQLMNDLVRKTDEKFDHLETSWNRNNTGGRSRP
ncbi:uncharacterized protein LOC131264509 [Anopheles coustani]|uniref:uncharacterized protein LOC131264509 n=1 Tax=Anopheles coustani TaxID=139045 RepID=UPI002659E4BC|nr:uncharacterized protein LOC131264509 [Anopheles coustani]